MSNTLTRFLREQYVFSAVFFLSLLTLIFCVVMLLVRPCDETVLWVSLVSLIMGYWLRLPSFRDTKPTVQNEELLK
jgi:hypothetical protein